MVTCKVAEAWMFYVLVLNGMKQKTEIEGKQFVKNFTSKRGFLFNTMSTVPHEHSNA